MREILELLGAIFCWVRRKHSFEVWNHRKSLMVDQRRCRICRHMDMKPASPKDVVDRLRARGMG